MLTFYKSFFLTTICCLLISGCGGGGTSTATPTPDPAPSTPDPAPPIPVTATLTFSQVKLFQFNWTDVENATFYRVLENPDGLSGFTQVGSDITTGIELFEHIVPLYSRLNAQYIVQSCSNLGCTDSNTISVSGTLTNAIGFIKASNTEAEDGFAVVSISVDGSTLAVGAIDEDSNARGIDNDQFDNSATGSGAVYIFVRNDTNWSQQAYIKSSNSDPGDNFGLELHLSADGNTLAVGVYAEDSNTTGVNGNQTDNSLSRAGAVYIYARSGETWNQQAYIKASNTNIEDDFGDSVRLSADGNTLAVGADQENSNATGIDGDQLNNSLINAGAVYIYT